MNLPDEPLKHNPSSVSQRMLRLLIVLLILLVALVSWSRWTERPLVAEQVTGDVLYERVLLLNGAIDGSAQVADEHGNVLAQFGPNEAVFISTIVRVLERERLKHKADPDAPIVLRMREGERLSVFDPQTDRETELESFGKDNVAAFQALIAEK